MKNNARELAEKYCELIKLWDDTFKPSNPEQFLEKLNYPPKLKRICLDIIEFMNNDFYERCMPWKLIEGDLQDNLTKIFLSKDKIIISYLKFGDYLSDQLTDSMEKDLTKYYSTKGIDVLNEEFQERIIDEVFSLKENTNLDSNIFSKETTSLHFIENKASKVCDELYEYFKSDTNNKNLELEEEIEK